MAQRRVIHRNSQTVWLFDYPSMLAMDNIANRLIFLSERDWNMIWQATKDIDLWQSRVWVEANNENYLTVDDTQFETFGQWVSDMRIHLGDFEMIEEVLAEIRDAIQALVDKPCCPDGSTSGSFGSGSAEVPPNPYDQGSAGGVPPDGFSSMEEFDAYKCNRAEDILNALKADLIGLSGLVYSGASPTGIVGTLVVFMLSPIPFDELVALAAYLIYSAYSYSFLAEMAALIEDNQDDLRCLLYNADTVGDAVSDFMGEIETLALAHYTTMDDAEWTVGAVDYFMTNDNFNKLFENIPTVSQDAVCDCGECTPILYTFDTTVEGWTLVAATCDSQPQSGTPTLSWLGGGHLRLQCSAASGLRAIIARSPTISTTLTATSVLRLRGNTNNGASVFCVPRLVTSGGCRVMSPSVGFPLTPITDRTWSLSAYAGETVTEIQIYVNNSVGSNIDMNFSEVEISC